MTARGRRTGGCGVRATRAVFDAYRQKAIASLQADRSPWDFGIGASFEHGQEVFCSMVKRARARPLFLQLAREQTELAQLR